MSDLATILAKVIAIVKDDSGKLTNPTDYEHAIATALTAYSKHKPLELIDDIYGDGTEEVVLPTSWSPGFSALRSVEYPVGAVPPTLLESEDYYVVARAGICYLTFDLASTETVRVTITVIRTADDIDDIDVDAFCNLAASFALEALANAFTQAGDSTINADTVNYRTKSGEFAARAKRLYQLYKDHLGIKETDSSPAAAAVADFDMKYPGGDERLTHPRYDRRRR